MRKVCLPILGIGFLLASASAAVPTAGVVLEDVLRKVDEVRNPSESYQMKVSVLSGNNSDEHSDFDVSIDGNQKTLIRTLAPVRDRGRNLLMLGEDMWSFIPNLNRAIRVSLNQRLTGQAANGDISRMRWSGDYTPAIESETPNEWVLFLTAKRKGLTYEKMRIWVEKETYYPKKAEFLTLAGQPLKKVEYGTFIPLAGRVRPSKIRIQDAIRVADFSVVEIREMIVKNFPASVFSQNALK